MTPKSRPAKKRARSLRTSKPRVVKGTPSVALTREQFRERFAPQGLEAVGGSPEQFAKLYRDDYEKYGRLVKELNIKVD